MKDDFKTTNKFVSKTDGKELPDEVTKLLPTGQEHLVKNDKVDADTSFVKEVKVSDGIWKFVGWDKDSVTIDNKDEEFIGSLEFTKDQVTDNPTTDDTTRPDKDISYDDENNQDKDSTANSSSQNDSENTRSQNENLSARHLSNVETGDHTSVGIYFGLFVVAFLGIVLLLRKQLENRRYNFIR